MYILHSTSRCCFTQGQSQFHLWRNVVFQHLRSTIKCVAVQAVERWAHARVWILLMNKRDHLLKSCLEIKKNFLGLQK